MLLFQKSGLINPYSLSSVSLYSNGSFGMFWNCCGSTCKSKFHDPGILVIGCTPVGRSHPNALVSWLPPMELRPPMCPKSHPNGLRYCKRSNTKQTSENVFGVRPLCAIVNASHPKGFQPYKMQSKSYAQQCFRYCKRKIQVHIGNSKPRLPTASSFPQCKRKIINQSVWLHTVRVPFITIHYHSKNIQQQRSGRSQSQPQHLNHPGSPQTHPRTWTPWVESSFEVTISTSAQNVWYEYTWIYEVLIDHALSTSKSPVFKLLASGKLGPKVNHLNLNRVTRPTQTDRSPRSQPGTMWRLMGLKSAPLTWGRLRSTVSSESSHQEKNGPAWLTPPKESMLWDILTKSHRQHLRQRASDTSDSTTSPSSVSWVSFAAKSAQRMGYGENHRANNSTSIIHNIVLLHPLFAPKCAVSKKKHLDQRWSKMINLFVQKDVTVKGSKKAMLIHKDPMTPLELPWPSSFSWAVRSLALWPRSSRQQPGQYPRPPGQLFMLSCYIFLHLVSKKIMKNSCHSQSQFLYSSKRCSPGLCKSWDLVI